MSETETRPRNPASDETAHAHDELQDYQGGEIQDRHGYIPVWLLVVYAVMFFWGLYYAYVYWGGFGPGRI